MVVLGSAYCNVKVYRLKRETSGSFIERTLIREAHNLVLDSGLAQLAGACEGTAWELSAIGLGDDGTAVTAADTWGLGSLVVAAPTSSYFKDNLYRATLLLEEDEQNGETIREVWIAPDTTGPPGGEDAYARVVIDAIAKTDEYAYLFIIDCSWGNSGTGGTRAAWEMMAALAKSGGAYTLACDTLWVGSGTKAESVDDTACELPWIMVPLAAASSTATDNQLALTFTIDPDTYIGNTAREAGLYFTTETGSPPTGTGLFARTVFADEYEVPVGEGATVSVILVWEAG